VLKRLDHIHEVQHEILKCVAVDPAKIHAAYDAIHTLKSDTVALKSALKNATKGSL